MSLLDLESDAGQMQTRKVNLFVRMRTKEGSQWDREEEDPILLTTFFCLLIKKNE